MQDETRQAAETMRRYMVQHLGQAITAAQVAAAAGYSPRHGNRLFKACTGKSIGAYLRLLRLSAAAESLAGSNETVLQVALEHRYDSHEGFTKAFTSAFGLSPIAYRRGQHPIPYFIPYPITHSQAMFDEFDENEKEPPMNDIITATILQRPARKLICLYSKTGTDYWSFCQEQGCDWEGLLLSIKARMDLPAFVTLPPAMVPAGHAIGAVGVEVPADYSGEVPGGYTMIDLPAGAMVHFQSPPYEDEDDFASAITAVFDAYERYTPEAYGYAFDTHSAPVFNFGAFADKGARIAVPAKKL